MKDKKGDLRLPSGSGHVWDWGGTRDDFVVNIAP
jgi:hypothetical protein